MELSRCQPAVDGRFMKHVNRGAARQDGRKCSRMGSISILSVPSILLLLVMVM